jgi:hypothetical protein
MNDKKKSYLLVVNFIAICACYLLIFQILSGRETSTLNIIYKQLESKGKSVKENDTKAKTLLKSKIEKINYELPLYFENESLISYVRRMIILKQNGFWEINLNEIFKNKDLFTDMKKQVSIFQDKYLKKEGNKSVSNLEKELEKFLYSEIKEISKKHYIFTEILILKLSYYHLTEKNTFSNFDPLFSNTFGKYLMIFSCFLLFLAILNLKNKGNKIINTNPVITQHRS